jgi:hypothetical protein
LISCGNFERKTRREEEGSSPLGFYDYHPVIRRKRWNFQLIYNFPTPFPLQYF